MTKKVLLNLFALGSLSLATLAQPTTQPTGRGGDLAANAAKVSPIPERINPELLKSSYLNPQLPVGIQFYVDNKLAKGSPTLQRAISDLYADVIASTNSSPVARCLSELNVDGENILSALRTYFETGAQEVGNHEALIVLSRIDTNAGKESTLNNHVDDIIYAEEHLIRTLKRDHESQIYVHIGVSEDVLLSINPVTGYNSRFWSAMLTIGILKNLGVHEDITSLYSSVPTRAAQCVLFDGVIPEEYKIIELMNEKDLKP